jgi:hypothetical protein
LRKIHPTLQNAGGKTGKVADHAPAQRHNDRTALDVLAQKRVHKLAERGKTFGLLAGRHDDRERLEARSREACRKAVIMKPGDRFVRDDGHAPRRRFRQLCG